MQWENLFWNMPCTDWAPKGFKSKDTLLPKNVNRKYFLKKKKAVLFEDEKKITLAVQINFTISKLVFLLHFVTCHQSISCSFLRNESTIEMCKVTLIFLFEFFTLVVGNCLYCLTLFSGTLSSTLALFSSFIGIYFLRKQKLKCTELWKTALETVCKKFPPSPKCVS